MASRLQVICAVVALLCLPLLSSAQSSASSNVVSVRELSIPPKALRAFEQGRRLLSQQDAEGSLPQFQRAVAEFANFYEAYCKMGQADLKLMRIVEAEQAFRKSLELSGGQYAPAMLALGAVLDYRQKYSEAAAVSREGMNLDPAAWQGHYYLGLALFGLNRLEEAEQSAREALRLRNNSPEALRLLADIHSREKDYRALLDDLDEYLKLDPASPISVRARALRDSARRALAESENTSALAQPTL